MVTEVPVPSDIGLAVIICKDYQGDYINTIGEMCGLAKATLCAIFSEISTVTLNTLWDNAVNRHFPNSEDNIWHCMSIVKNGNFSKHLQLRMVHVYL